VLWYRRHKVCWHAHWVAVLNRCQRSARMHRHWSTNANSVLALQPQKNHSRYQIRQQSACYTHLVCKKCTVCFRACNSVEFVPLPLLIKSFDATNVGKLSQRSDGINCNYGKIRVCLFQLLRFYWKSSYSFVMMATHGPVARITYTVLVVLVEWWRR